MAYSNVNLVGSLTRTGNILSNFSSSNYATLNKPFNPQDNDFEIGMKFTTSSNFTTASSNRFLFHCPTATSSRGFTIHIQGSSTILSINSSNSDDSGWSSTAVGHIYDDLSPNTTYWLKVKRENNSIKTFYSLDGENYTMKIDKVLDYSYPNFIKTLIGTRWNPSNNTSYDSLDSTVSIDLDECYIDINGNRFWEGVYHPQQLGYKAIKSYERIYYKNGVKVEEPNLEVYGNPTFDSYYSTATNFSNSNYLKLAKPFNPENNPWYIQLGFTTGNIDSLSTDTALFGNYGQFYQNSPEVVITTDKKFRINIPKDGTQEKIVNNIKGSFIVSSNTTYYIKLEFTGTNYQLSYKTQLSDNWTIDINVTDSRIIYQQPEGFIIGNNFYSTTSDRRFLGTIDLSQFLIVINGYWKSYQPNFNSYRDEYVRRMIYNKTDETYSVYSEIHPIQFWEVPRELTTQGVYQYPSSNFEVNLPDSVKEIDEHALHFCFYGCPKVTAFNAKNITSIKDYGLCYGFSNCTSLATIPEFDKLITIGNSGLQTCFQGCRLLTTAPTFVNVNIVGQQGLSNGFYSCTSLTTAPTFANLTTIEYNGMMYCFYNCTSLTTAPTFANLTTVKNYGFSSCFQNCTSLTTTPTFANLTTIGNSGFQNCFQNTKITSLSFPKLNSTSFGNVNNQFNNMLSGVTGCTVHFPSNLQSVIGSWSSVTAGFGGINTTVLFDLTATS